jgi:hypothetical protein
LQGGDGGELEGLNREYEEKFGGLRYVYVPFSLLFNGF